MTKMEIFLNFPYTKTNNKKKTIQKYYDPFRNREEIHDSAFLYMYCLRLKFLLTELTELSFVDLSSELAEHL